MTMQILRAVFEAKLSKGSADRTIDVIASTPSLDGNGRVVLQDWDLARYEKNPVVLWNHGLGAGFFGDSGDTDLTLPIGFATNVRVEQGLLKATLNFVDERANPIAEKVWQGIQQGSIRAVSVGWQSGTVRWETHDNVEVAVLSQNELLEISAVAVPANADAVKEGARLAASLRAMRDEREGKTTTMKNLFAKLGLPETATESDALAKLAELDGAASAATATLERACQIAGCKSGEELVATVLGLTEKAKQLEERIQADAKAKAEADAAEVERLWKAAITEGRATPASREKLMRALGEKASVEQVRIVVDALDVPISNTEATRARTSAPEHAALEWHGKRYSQLSFEEKHQLATEDYAHFVAMREASESDGDEPTPES